MIDKTTERTSVATLSHLPMKYKATDVAHNAKRVRNIIKGYNNKLTGNG